VGEAIEKAYRPVAELAQAAGRKKGGPKGGRGKKKPSGELPRKVSGESSRTTAVAAAAVGVDRRTYEKAKEVVASGDKEAIEEMRKTGKVNGAHKKLKRKEGGAAGCCRHMRPFGFSVRDSEFA